ncbi:MAG: hypothetical protein ACI4PF_06565, partial [Christensenellales bacterium]
VNSSSSGYYYAGLAFRGSLRDCSFLGPIYINKTSSSSAYVCVTALSYLGSCIGCQAIVTFNILGSYGYTSGSNKLVMRCSTWYTPPSALDYIKYNGYYYYQCFFSPYNSAYFVNSETTAGSSTYVDFKISNMNTSTSTVAHTASMRYLGSLISDEQSGRVSTAKGNDVTSGRNTTYMSDYLGSSSVEEGNKRQVAWHYAGNTRFYNSSTGIIRQLVDLSPTTVMAMGGESTKSGNYTTVTPQSTYTLGSSTLSNSNSIYVISNAKQLNYISYLANVKGETFSGKHIIITADINLVGYVWNPIPNFKGTFMGQGYTISNVLMFSTTGADFGDNSANLSNCNVVATGFFSTITTGAKIINVTLNRVHIVGTLMLKYEGVTLPTSTSYGPYLANGGLVGTVLYNTSSGAYAVCISQCNVQYFSVDFNGIYFIYWGYTLQGPSTYPNSIFYGTSTIIGIVGGYVFVEGLVAKNSSYMLESPYRSSDTKYGNGYVVGAFIASSSASFWYLQGNSIYTDAIGDLYSYGTISSVAGLRYDRSVACCYMFGVNVLSYDSTYGPLPNVNFIIAPNSNSKYYYSYSKTSPYAKGYILGTPVTQTGADVAKDILSFTGNVFSIVSSSFGSYSQAIKSMSTYLYQYWGIYNTSSDYRTCYINLGSYYINLFHGSRYSYYFKVNNTTDSSITNLYTNGVYPFYNRVSYYLNGTTLTTSAAGNASAEQNISTQYFACAYDDTIYFNGSTAAHTISQNRYNASKTYITYNSSSGLGSVAAYTNISSYRPKDPYLYTTIDVTLNTKDAYFVIYEYIKNSSGIGTLTATGTNCTVTKVTSTPITHTEPFPFQTTLFKVTNYSFNSSSVTVSWQGPVTESNSTSHTVNIGNFSAERSIRTYCTWAGLYYEQGYADCYLINNPLLLGSDISYSRATPTNSTKTLTLDFSKPTIRNNVLKMYSDDQTAIQDTQGVEQEMLDADPPQPNECTYYPIFASYPDDGYVDENSDYEISYSDTSLNNDYTYYRITGDAMAYWGYSSDYTTQSSISSAYVYFKTSSSASTLYGSKDFFVRDNNTLGFSYGNSQNFPSGSTVGPQVGNRLVKIYIYDKNGYGFVINGDDNEYDSTWSTFLTFNPSNATNISSQLPFTLTSHPVANNHYYQVYYQFTRRTFTSTLKFEQLKDGTAAKGIATATVNGVTYDNSTTTTHTITTYLRWNTISITMPDGMPNDNGVYYASYAKVQSYDGSATTSDWVGYVTGDTSGLINHTTTLSESSVSGNDFSMLYVTDTITLHNKYTRTSVTPVGMYINYHMFSLYHIQKAVYSRYLPSEFSSIGTLEVSSSTGEKLIRNPIDWAMIPSNSSYDETDKFRVENDIDFLDFDYGSILNNNATPITGLTNRIYAYSGYIELYGTLNGNFHTISNGYNDGSGGVLYWNCGLVKDIVFDNFVDTTSFLYNPYYLTYDYYLLCGDDYSGGGVFQNVGVLTTNSYIPVWGGDLYIFSHGEYNKTTFEKCYVDIKIKKEYATTNPVNVYICQNNDGDSDESSRTDCYSYITVLEGVDNNINLYPIEGGTNTNTTIQNCWSAVRGEDSDKSLTEYLTNCVPIATNAQVTNCYYLAGSAVNAGTTVLGTELSYNEMKNRSSFNGFNFGSTWYMDTTTEEGTFVSSYKQYNHLFPVLITGGFEIARIRPNYIYVNDVRLGTTSTTTDNCWYSLEIDGSDNYSYMYIYTKPYYDSSNPTTSYSWKIRFPYNGTCIKGSTITINLEGHISEDNVNMSAMSLDSVLCGGITQT